MSSFATIWQYINQPARELDFSRLPPKPVWRVFKQYFLARHPGNLLLAVLLASTVGLTPFVMSFTIKFLSDEVLEVHITEEAAKQQVFDPTTLDQNQTFKLPGDTAVADLGTQHEQKPGKSTHEKLYLLAWLAAGLLLWEIYVHVALFIVFERTVEITQDGVYFRMRQQLHDKLHALPMTYHDRYATGRLLTHLFSDMATMQMASCFLIRNIPKFSVAILVGLGILFYLNVTMALYASTSLVLFGVGYRWFKNRQKAVSVNLREREGRLIAHMNSRVSNFNLVKAFRRETAETRDFLYEATPNLLYRVASITLSVGMTLLWGTLAICTTAMVIWLGVNNVRTGLMTAGDFLLFNFSAGALFPFVAQFSQQFTHYYNMRAASIKVMRVFDEPVELTSPIEPKPLPNHSPKLTFQNTSFTYPQAPQKAVDDVSFTIEPGKRLAIMGPSGAGKSTLAKLAVRLYDPTEGEVTIDDVPLWQFRLTELRKFLGFVNQEPIVFSGSLADNIRYGTEHAPPEEVINAATYAQIHDFIEQLPKRYRTITQERGLTLSGGQKQRMNLARALLAEPKMIVMDDCTSALDAETEAKLIEAFDTSLKDRTVLLVTHRVCVALGCDHVMMMEDGRMVEYGSPWQLLEEDGVFADLYRQQVGRLQLASA